MEKHLLMTISSDREASSTLRFLRHFFDNLCDIRLTLFYVAPRQSDENDYHFVPSALEAKGQASMPVETIKSPEAREALKKARDWIVAEGCKEHKVETKAVFSRFGMVHDIIQEGHSGKYDAVVLGRRGLSWLGELMDQSVTTRIVWERIDFPVWITRRPETGLSRDVLLCLDGSEAALRMADHVGFMLDAAPRQKIVLFHTYKDANDAAPIFQAARDALTDNGVDPSRIEECAVQAKDPAEAILKEAKKRHISVVAMGRRGHGASPGPMSMLFPGAVSMNVLREMEDFTLWVSK